MGSFMFILFGLVMVCKGEKRLLMEESIQEQMDQFRIEVTYFHYRLCIVVYIIYICDANLTAIFYVRVYMFLSRTNVFNCR